MRVPGDQPTIQLAIDAAAAGDTVLVAPGTYTGTGNKELTTGNKDLEIRSESGAEVTAIDCGGSGRAFFLSGLLTNGTVIDGFTVRNGVGGQSIGGGGMFIAGGSPMIANCSFEQNTAAGLLQNGGGGAISVYNASPLIVSCVFIGNSATGSGTVGGAIAFHQSSGSVVRDCHFERNTATIPSGLGGGIGIVFASVTPPIALEINNCEFLDNEAGHGGGAMVARTKLTYCTFEANGAQNGGGLVAISGAVEDCSIVGNSSTKEGGGAELGKCTVARSSFSGNTSGAVGGGVRCTGPEATFTDCLIAGNSAEMGGGFAGQVVGSGFVNCTVTNNRAPIGSGVYLSAQQGATWFFENTIITGNGPGEAIVCVGGANAEMSCSNVYGNEGGDWVGCIMGQDSAGGNLSADPLFCQAGSDWRLCSDSPCAPDQSGRCGLIGALPVGCGDCGVQALTPTTWGQIKYQARKPARVPSASK